MLLPVTTVQVEAGMITRACTNLYCVLSTTNPAGSEVPDGKPEWSTSPQDIVLQLQALALADAATVRAMLNEQDMSQERFPNAESLAVSMVVTDLRDIVVLASRIVCCGESGIDLCAKGNQADWSRAN